MNITLPQIKNSGFLSKKVELTYTKLHTSIENLGEIPAFDGMSDPEAVGPDRFVADTSGKAAHPTYYRRSVEVENPKLDAAGRPILETVTETVKVPGPKGEALRELGSWTANALVFGAAVTLPLAGFGALASKIFSDSALLTGSLWVAAGLSALIAGPSLAIGFSMAKEQFGKTNTLSMVTTDIVKQKMVGYDAVGKSDGIDYPYLSFQPRLEGTVLGQWVKPTITHV